MFNVEKLDRSFGAKVFDITLNKITEIEMQQLYELWLECALLIFPAQNLTNEEQVIFAKLFGNLEFDLSQRTVNQERHLEKFSCYNLFL